MQPVCIIGSQRPCVCFPCPVNPNIWINLVNPPIDIQLLLRRSICRDSLSMTLCLMCCLSWRHKEVLVRVLDPQTAQVMQPF